MSNPEQICNEFAIWLSDKTRHMSRSAYKDTIYFIEQELTDRFNAMEEDGVEE